MLAGGLFRACKWSATQVLVFHFVRERPSVPCSSYRTCQLVNKQPGWFSVPFILPRFSVQQGAVKRNKMDFWICASGLVRCKLLLRKLSVIMNKLLIQLLWQPHWLSEGTARQWSRDRAALCLYDSLQTIQTLHMYWVCAAVSSVASLGVNKRLLLLFLLVFNNKCCLYHWTHTWKHWMYGFLCAPCRDSAIGTITQTHDKMKHRHTLLCQLPSTRTPTCLKWPKWGMTHCC